MVATEYRIIWTLSGDSNRTVYSVYYTQGRLTLCYGTHSLSSDCADGPGRLVVCRIRSITLLHIIRREFHEKMEVMLSRRVRERLGEGLY